MRTGTCTLTLCMAAVLAHAVPSDPSVAYAFTRANTSTCGPTELPFGTTSHATSVPVASLTTPRAVITSKRAGLSVVAVTRFPSKKMRVKASSSSPLSAP